MLFSNRFRRALILIMAVLVGGAVTFHFTKRGPVSVHGNQPGRIIQTQLAKSETLRGTKKSRPEPEPIGWLPAQETDAVAAGVQTIPDGHSQPNQRDERDVQLDHETRQVVAKLLSASPDEALELRKQLESLIDRHFEYRQQQRKREIDQLSQRVDALRLSQIRRQENKTEIVKRRLNELIDPAANLDWDASRPRGETATTSLMDPTQGSTLPQHSSPPDPIANIEQTSPHEGHPISKSTLTSNPTYQRRALSVWLQKMESERDPELLCEAVRALQHLSADADPRVLIRATIQMAQSIGISVPYDWELRRVNGIVPPSYSLVDLSVQLLRSVPPSILVEELIQHLTKDPSRRATGTFQAVINGLLVRAVQLDQSDLVLNPQQSKSTPHYKGLAREFSEHAQKMIDALVLLAKRDDTLEDWVVDSSIRILSLNDESLAKFPDLVPMMQRFFLTKSNPFHTRGEAAVILGRSGILSDQVLVFLQMALEPQLEGEARQMRQRHSPAVLTWFKRLAPHMPEATMLLKDRLADLIGKIEGGHINDADVTECIRFLRYFADLGESAEGTLPALRLLSEKRIAEMSLPYDSLGDFAGKVFRPRGTTLRDNINDAIQQIETAVAESKAEADVGKVATPGRTFIGLGLRTELSDQPNSNPPLRETTFDGRTYSAWLEMLETERKPEMLVTAIDACSRLAQPKDEARIVRGIFQAASFFEKGNSDEKALVWNAAFTGMNRLAGEVILDVLIAAAKGNESPPIHRAVQFQIWDQLQLTSFREAVKSRAETIMTEFTSVKTRSQIEHDDLVALTSCVWSCSGRPLDDFPDMKKRMIELVDSGRGLPTGTGYLDYTSQWCVTAANLASLAPEVPGLGLMIAKQAKSRPQVVILLSRLGPAAEAAVPTLVELFLEDQRTFLQAERGDFLIYADQSDYLQSIIATLGNIGIDAKGYALLNELNHAAISYYGTNDGAKISRAIADAFARYAPPSSPENGEKLLDDRVLINGLWSIRETKLHPGISPNVRIHAQNWKYNDSGVVPNKMLNRFSLNVASTPRQITFTGTTDADGAEMSQFGIYELTETSLKVQVAPIGEPRPTEFISDEASLPQGHVLLELERPLVYRARPQERSKR